MHAGGAIYYNLYSPKFLENNIFVNNSAHYGPDIGSYPFKLGIIDASMKSLKLFSGQILEEPLNIGLFD